MKLRTAVLAAALSAAAAHLQSPGQRSALLRASSALHGHDHAPASPASTQALPPAAAPVVPKEEALAASPAAAPVVPKEEALAAPDGLKEHVESQKEEQPPVGEELQEPAEVKEKANDGAAGELPSVMLRFELRNIDFTMLDVPSHVSPLLGATGAPAFLGRTPEFETIKERGEDMDVSHDHDEQTNRQMLEKAVKGAVEEVVSAAMGKASALNEDDEDDEQDEQDEHKDHSKIVGGAEVSLVAKQANWTSTNSAAVDPRVKLLKAVAGPALDNTMSAVVHHREVLTRRLAGASSPAAAPLAEMAPAAAPLVGAAPAAAPLVGAAPSAAPLVGAAPAAAAAAAPAASPEVVEKPEQPSGLRVPGDKEEPEAGQKSAAEQEQAAPAAKKAGPGDDSPPVMSVSFEPGAAKRGPLSLLASSNHGNDMTPRSTIAKVNIIDKPGTGSNKIGEIEDVLRDAIEDGGLQRTLATAVSAAVNVNAVIGSIFEDTGVVKPYDTPACAAHLKTLIGRFSTAYTRARVPEALYHACDNWSQKESFSDDGVVDKQDRHRCRTATKRFVNLWQHGKGKVDYGRYCLELCEIKHGEDAIRCDAYKYIGMGK